MGMATKPSPKNAARTTATQGWASLVASHPAQATIGPFYSENQPEAFTVTLMSPLFGVTGMPVMDAS